MKKLFILFSITLLTFSCTQSSKIGYVDIQKVMEEYQGAKEAEKALQEKSNQINLELQQINSQFQAKVQEYQNNRSKMSASKQRKQEGQLMQEQQMIQQRQQMVQKQFQEEGNQMIEKINEEIESFIQSYAKEKGYDMILGTSQQTRTVLYGKEGFDLTDAVIEALNAQNTDKSTEKQIDSLKTP